MIDRKIRLRKEKKKAQEEIVGFVLVIVLIAVIALVFLGLQLRQKPVEAESEQIANLLDAMLKYTTDCQVSLPQYESLADLIKSCYNQEKCNNDMQACQHLQETADRMLSAALSDLQAESPVKAYSLNISYSTAQFVFGRKSEAELLVLSKGKCTGRSIGYKRLLPIDFGNIEIILRFCY